MVTRSSRITVRQSTRCNEKAKRGVSWYAVFPANGGEDLATNVDERLPRTPRFVVSDQPSYMRRQPTPRQFGQAHLVQYPAHRRPYRDPQLLQVHRAAVVAGLLRPQPAYPGQRPVRGAQDVSDVDVGGWPGKRQRAPVRSSQRGLKKRGRGPIPGNSGQEAIANAT